jgi:hypothetical protein
MDLPDRDRHLGVAPVGPASLVLGIVKGHAYDSDQGMLDEVKPAAGAAGTRSLAARVPGRLSLTTSRLECREPMLKDSEGNRSHPGLTLCGH